MAGRKAFEGDGITVFFEGRRCIHAAECVTNLPAVFSADHRPWIKADGAAADAIADVIHRCPSGALTFERTDGGAAEPTDIPSAIRIVKDGPLYVRGMIDVVNAEGETVSAGPRVALCRCGASKNKPFCDLSHKDAGFTD